MLIFVDKKHASYLDAGEEGGGHHSSYQWSDVLGLGSVFWLLCLTTFAMYFSVLPFISFSTEFLTNKYGLSDVAAGWMTGTFLNSISSSG